MAITPEQIWAAADAIDAAGQKPTLAAVRKAVGGGSYTTISETMAQWRAHKAESAEPLREPAPPQVLERLQETGAEIWSAALEVATQRLSAEREALNAAHAELENSRQEAAQLADQLATDLDECKIRFAAMQEVEASLRKQLDELKQSLSAESASNTILTRDIEQLRNAAELAHQRELAAREELAEMRGRLQLLEEQNAQMLARLSAANT